ncbi:hypothetical protein [Mucilaginibacter sp. JRF]|nr:hypothetical protein [Mucilaginibacter sp. JRF]
MNLKKVTLMIIVGFLHVKAVQAQLPKLISPNNKISVSLLKPAAGGS